MVLESVITTACTACDKKDAEIVALKTRVAGVDAELRRERERATEWEGLAAGRVAEEKRIDALLERQINLRSGDNEFNMRRQAHIVEDLEAAEARVADLESTLSDLHDQLYEASMMVTDDHHKMLSAIVSERDEGRARIAELEHERDEVLAMHARILSWAPADAEAAYASILRVAADFSRDGFQIGKTLREAVDALKKYVSQVKASQDMAARE